MYVSHRNGVRRLDEDQITTSQGHISKKNWTTSSKFINYSTLNSKHN